MTGFPVVDSLCRYIKKRSNGLSSQSEPLSKGFEPLSSKPHFGFHFWAGIDLNIPSSRNILLETPIEIVAKKLWYRGDRLRPEICSILRW